MIERATTTQFLFTEADRRELEALVERCLDRVIEQAYLQLAREYPWLAPELERRRRQRRKKRRFTAAPGGVGSPPSDEVAVGVPAEAPAAEAGAAAALAPAGGPQL